MKIDWDFQKIFWISALLWIFVIFEISIVEIELSFKKRLLWLILFPSLLGEFIGLLISKIFQKKSMDIIREGEDLTFWVLFGFPGYLYFMSGLNTILDIIFVEILLLGWNILMGWACADFLPISSPFRKGGMRGI